MAGQARRRQPSAQPPATRPSEPIHRATYHLPEASLWPEHRPPFQWHWLRGMPASFAIEPLRRRTNTMLATSVRRHQGTMCEYQLPTKHQIIKSFNRPSITPTSTSFTINMITTLQGRQHPQPTTILHNTNSDTTNSKSNSSTQQHKQPP